MRKANRKPDFWDWFFLALALIIGIAVIWFVMRYIGDAK